MSALGSARAGEACVPPCSPRGSETGVELVALTGVLSLYSQIVQAPGGHSFRAEGRGGRQAPKSRLGQRRANRRPLSVLGGV